MPRSETGAHTHAAPEDKISTVPHGRPWLRAQSAESDRGCPAAADRGPQTAPPAPPRLRGLPPPPAVQPPHARQQITPKRAASQGRRRWYLVRHGSAPLRAAGSAGPLQALRSFLCPQRKHRPRRAREFRCA